MIKLGQVVFALAAAGSMAIVACGGGGGGSADAPAGIDSGSGSAAATVMTVDCASGSADAVVTAKTFAYTSTPAGSASNNSEIPLNGIVEFNLDPATTHPVQPYAAGGMTDSGIHAADGAVTCLKFTAPGTFHYDCMVHGPSVQGTVTVSQ
jgi:plastocyanin